MLAWPGRPSLQPLKQPRAGWSPTSAYTRARPSIPAPLPRRNSAPDLAPANTQASEASDSGVLSAARSCLGVAMWLLNVGVWEYTTHYGTTPTCPCPCPIASRQAHTSLLASQHEQEHDKKGLALSEQRLRPLPLPRRRFRNYSAMKNGIRELHSQREIGDCIRGGVESSDSYPMLKITEL